MTRARDLARLGNNQSLTIDTNLNVGIGSTTPDAKLDVVGVVSATSFNGNSINVGSAVTINASGVNVTGVVTATSFNGNSVNVTGVVTANNGIKAIGIYSGNNVITTGIITALNFVGTGNTFAVVGNRVDISIAGGSGGGGATISTTAPTSPTDGQQWFDSSDGNTYIWYNNQNVWVVSQTYGY